MQGRVVNFLLDTNVVSEWAKPRPDAGVAAWLAEVDEARTFISVITLAELRHGIERLPGGARRERLDRVPLRFEERLLTIDADTANVWGRIMAQGQVGIAAAGVAAGVAGVEPLGVRMSSAVSGSAAPVAMSARRDIRGGVAKLTTGPGLRRAGGAQGAARQGCAAHADYEA
jgi:predicted nucleic acid-binding protein